MKQVTKSFSIPINSWSSSKNGGGADEPFLVSDNESLKFVYDLFILRHLSYTFDQTFSGLRLILIPLALISPAIEVNKIDLDTFLSATASHHSLMMSKRTTDARLSNSFRTRDLFPDQRSLSVSSAIFSLPSHVTAAMVVSDWRFSSDGTSESSSPLAFS